MTHIPQPTLESTVGELVAQQPARSRVFEKLGIDFCCGGRKSLGEACEGQGLDGRTVLSMLLAAETGGEVEERDWSIASPTELADHIEQTHHAYLAEELPRLQAMVRKVAAVHGERYPWMLELDGVFAAFRGELESHAVKEEQVLFPMIRRLEDNTADKSSPAGHDVASVVEVMEHEHDDAGGALARMRELSDGFTPPQDACGTFRAMLDALRELEADMHRHVHKENSILFPAALRLAE